MEVGKFVRIRFSGRTLVTISLIVLVVGTILGYNLSLIFVSTTLQTVTATITVTPEPPSEITVSGNISTKTFGTSATGIEFTSKKTRDSYSGEFSDSEYTATLPNGQMYDVEVEWTGLLGGNCFAGVLPVYISSEGRNLIKIDWSC